MNSVQQQPASPGLQTEISRTIRDVQQATRDAARTDADATRAQAEPLPPGTIVFSGDGSGDRVHVNVKGGNVVLTQGANSTTIPLNDVVPKGWCRCPGHWPRR